MNPQPLSNLFQGHCAACEGEVEVLSPDLLRQALNHLEGWEPLENPSRIRREFGFKNFHETMAFVNAVAWIAHTEDHHPDLEVGYKTCVVTYSTHSVGGVTRNDTVCACKINALLPGADAAP
jgi:4a-hydroxytetrahydrobiopterin dehydratase